MTPGKKPSRPTLGRFIAEYRGQPTNMRDVLGWYLPELLLVGGVLIYGGWRTYVGYMLYGPMAANIWGRPWFILAALFAIPILLLAYRYLRRVRFHVNLHENGLHLSPPNNVSLRWKQISGIATETIRYHLLGRQLYTRCRVAIYPTTTAPVFLDHRLQNLPELAEKIKEKIYPSIYPQLRTQLRSGQTLYFGTVKIWQKALGVNKHTYEWSHIKHINLQAGALIIALEKQGWLRRQIRIPTAQIPNIELLLKLIDEEINA